MRTVDEIIGKDAHLQLVFEGYAVVPVKPTDRMVENGGQTLNPMYTLTECYEAFRKAWAEAIDTCYPKSP